jgi:hypothetical protein
MFILAHSEQMTGIPGILLCILMFAIVFGPLIGFGFWLNAHDKHNDETPE